MEKRKGFLGVILIVIMTFLGVSSICYGMDRTPPAELGERSLFTPEILESYAARVPTVTAFGEGILRQSLISAAAELKKAKTAQKKVTFEFTVSVTELPSVPSRPDNVPNACFETCVMEEEALPVLCYAHCTAGGAPSFGPMKFIRTCGSIWADYNACTNTRCKVKYLVELVEAGCIITSIEARPGNIEMLPR